MCKHGFRAGIALVGLIWVVAGWAQEEPVPMFKSRTDVVLVPVIVRNKNAPVEGLKPEQFSVSEDGKPQQIASVELIKTGTNVQRFSPKGQFSNELVSQRPARLTIIGIDMINTPFLDQAGAREQLLKYLGESINTNEQIAVLVMNRDGSIQLLHDITVDAKQLAQVVKGVTSVATGDVTAGRQTPVDNTVTAERRILAGNTYENAGSGDPLLKLFADEEQAFQVFKESYSGPGVFELRRNMEATLQSMQQIALAFAGAPGLKTFIWITGSFPFDIDSNADIVSPKQYFTGSTQEADAYYRAHAGALPPLPDSSVIINDDELAPLRAQFRTMLQQFADASILLYPVDARGLMTLGLEAADDHDNQLLARMDRERNDISHISIGNMAKMTGGKSCYNKNQIMSCIRDASNDAEQYYLITYYRDKKKTKPGWRKLAVKVDQPNVDVRARTGYYYGGEASDKNARNREIAAALMSKVNLTAVPFSARYLSIVPEGNKKAVKYEIYIPPHTIDLADPGNGRFQLEIIAVASTPENPKADIVAETIGKNLPSEAIAAIHKKGIAYNNTLKLPPGEYDVHFMVRDATTNTIGTVVAPLRVE
jgi:VWFA-related protein